MGLPLFRRSVPKRHLPICVRGPSIRFLGEDLSPAALLQVQLVEIVHRCSGAASEDIHAIVVDDRDVRVSWDWRLAVHDEATPQRLAEVEDVDVIEMPRAIVTTEQIQGVPINGASGPWRRIKFVVSQPGESSAMLWLPRRKPLGKLTTLTDSGLGARGLRRPSGSFRRSRRRRRGCSCTPQRRGCAAVRAAQQTGRPSRPSPTCSSQNGTGGSR
eukprot:scaffold1136_cov260-Pinguiococcus_pyrenoidosus.AAC.14